MLEKQQSKDKVYMSVICLKQMIWSLGEDNRVYKLFIFSLSTELIKSAKTMGEQMLSQKTNAPVELLHCLSKKKKSKLPNSTDAANEIFNLLPFQYNQPQWRWVFAFQLYKHILSQTAEIQREL